MDQSQKRSWWNRNWKWVVPAGCLTPILVCGGFITLVFVFVFGAIKSSDVYIDSNVLIVTPGRNQREQAREGTVPTLTEADAHAIATECPSVQAVSPFIGTFGQVIGGDITWQPDQMLGVGPDYPHVCNWSVAAGRFFDDRDIAGATKVCVIGHTLALQLFPNTVPIGEQVRVKNIPFIVIGVLNRKGENLVGQDQDNILLMPYTTVRKRLLTSEFSNVDGIFVSARSEALSPGAEKEINSLLRDRHRIQPGDTPDFEVHNTPRNQARVMPLPLIKSR